MGPLTRRRTRRAVYEEAHMPKLKARRQTRRAMYREAYTLGHVRGGIRARAQGEEANTSGR